MLSVAGCSLQMDEYRKRTAGIDAASSSVRSTYAWRVTACSTTLQVRLIDYNSWYYLLPGGNAEQAKCVRVSVAPTKSVSVLL